MSLIDTIRFNFAITDNDVRVTFRSTSDTNLWLHNRLDNPVGRGDGSICDCPPTLKNLLVVRELLDKAIAAQNG